MKICPQHISDRAACPQERGGGTVPILHSAFCIQHSRRAFTMVEIAICLAIIGLALVAIIGVLPLGMNVQRDNREETVINQDATVILESIRNGVRSGFDLTNYIFGITNFATTFNSDGTLGPTHVYGYGPAGSSVDGAGFTPGFNITNNARIIGLLSTPEFLSGDVPITTIMFGGVSNRVYAYVRALSGPAAEKPPQDNSILVGDSFSYRILAVNAPVAVDTNIYRLPAAQRVYSEQLSANLHELRLTFAWPLRPNGLVTPDGPLPQTQRTMVAGTVENVVDHGQPLYYYQSQSFTNAP